MIFNKISVCFLFWSATDVNNILMIINTIFNPQVFIVIFFVSADWLLDRRHCNLKWQNAVKDIREKINVAIQDMPENEEIKQLLSGSCRILTIPYLHLL